MSRVIPLLILILLYTGDYIYEGVTVPNDYGDYWQEYRFEIKNNQKYFSVWLPSNSWLSNMIYIG